MLRADEVSIGYEAHTLAQGLTLNVQPGKLHCLLGPNGIGKSTLLRTLTGMQPPLKGTVWLSDTPIHRMDVKERAKSLAVVLTERVDAPTLTVYELVSLGRHPHTGWLGQLRDEDHAVIRQALKAVGASALADRPISAISDGQRQKALIARALAQQPEVLVLDEPTAYLDVPHRVEVMRILQGRAHHGQRAVLLSTHDLDLALRHADIVWLMAPSANGAAIHTGTPEDLILQGAFQTTFDRYGIHFDVETGAFDIAKQQRQPVTVEGEGHRAYWTERALQRAGFAITEGASLRVVVMSEGWRLILPDAPPQRVSSIAELLAQLQAVVG
jgi:iron complex transport system ATP-binding protein